MKLGYTTTQIEIMDVNNVRCLARCLSLLIRNTVCCSVQCLLPLVPIRMHRRHAHQNAAQKTPHAQQVRQGQQRGRHIPPHAGSKLHQYSIYTFPVLHNHSYP